MNCHRSSAYVPCIVALALAAVGGTTTSADADPAYRWTLSTSTTDPYVNAGPESPFTLTLYLWFVSPTSDGMAAAEFALSMPPAVTPLLFTTYNGFLNSGGVTELRLSVGLCPPGPVIAGSWLLSSAGLGRYCLVESSDGQLDTSDCVGPQRWPVEVTCYRAGAPPSWSISRSASDPLDADGPLAHDTASLYLWYQAPPGEGMTSAEFRLEAPSDATNLGFIAENGFVNSGDDYDLLLSAGGCPGGPVVAGHWAIQHQNLGGSYCLADAPPGHRITMDCRPTPHIQDAVYGCFHALPEGVGGWTLSSSDVSPADTVGTEPTPPGLWNLYLWYEGGGAGMSAAELALSTPDGVFATAFTPINGFLNGGTPLDLNLAVGGCPVGPVVAGVWNMFSLIPTATLCLQSNSSTGRRITLDCQTVPQEVNVPYGCYHLGTTAVESRSWAMIKSVYR